MAITNHERVGKALELLKEGLRPFVEREMKTQHAQLWFEELKASIPKAQPNLFGTEAEPRWDVASLLSVMWNQWQLVFRKTLGQAERSLLSELRDVRNRWAHQNPFSGDDTYRALDSAARLLTAVSAPQAADVEKMKMELLRVRFDEQVRTEKRKSVGTAIESQASNGLTPWREVVNPHTRTWPAGATSKPNSPPISGRCTSVRDSDEYLKPVEFFRRTYLTDSLQKLLVGAVQRLSGTGGDPVVQLQTNFGGGKTHSMLALYHMVSGTTLSELLGVDAVLKEARGGEIAGGEARGAGRKPHLSGQSGREIRRHGGLYALGRTRLATRDTQPAESRRRRRRSSASRPTTSGRPAPVTCCENFLLNTGPVSF